MAKMRTGVVFADVLGHDATTGKTLAGIFMLRVDIVGHDPTVMAFRLGRAEHITLDKLGPDELHELGVMMEAFRNQPVIDAAVVFDAVLVKVFDLAARRRRDTPALRQFADTLRHGTHFIRRELAGVDAALLKIAANFFVGVNVNEAEY